MTLWRRLSDFAARVRDAAVPSARTGGGASSAAFTMAVIALSAKMAKADGIVAPIEVDVFHKLFHTPPDEHANVNHVFDLAKTDTAGFEAYATQIRTQLDGDKVLLSEVLASLFHIATADRALHPAEDSFLRAVAERFGKSESEYRHIRAQFVHDDTSPYDVLGLTPHDDEATIKARHRKLVRENHPDLLIGRGRPAAMVEVATRRLAAINAAYDTIARERGL